MKKFKAAIIILIVLIVPGVATILLVGQLLRTLFRQGKV